MFSGYAAEEFLVARGLAAPRPAAHRAPRPRSTSRPRASDHPADGVCEDARDPRAAACSGDGLVLARVRMRDVSHEGRPVRPRVGTSPCSPRGRCVSQARGAGCARHRCRVSAGADEQSGREDFAQVARRPSALARWSPSVLLVSHRSDEGAMRGQHSDEKHDANDASAKDAAEMLRELRIGDVDVHYVAGHESRRSEDPTAALRDAVRPRDHRMSRRSADERSRRTPWLGPPR